MSEKDKKNRFDIMSMKRFKGKFRMSSGSFTSQAEQEEWTKYDDRLLDCVYKVDIPKLKQALQRKGVSSVKINKDGQSGLHLAVKKGLNEVVDILLGEQPDLSTQDSAGRTVYHLAAANGDVVMLKRLLDYSRWNLDIQDARKMSALHYAVGSGEIACVKLLLDHNSPTDMKDESSRTPLLLAISESYEKIAMNLVIHGAEFDLPDNLGRTPMILACMQGMSQVVALLVSKGAKGANQPIEKIAADGDVEEIERKLSQKENQDDESNKQKEQVDTEKPDCADLTKSEENDVFIDKNAQVTTPSLKKVHSPRFNSLRRNSNGSISRNSIAIDDNSFTSSIIESLMGFDVSSDTISETEDQIHEKQQLEEMQNTIKDKRISELESEVSSLHQKLKLEMEMRFAAETEIQQVKLHLEDVMENRPVTPSHENDVTFNDCDTNLLDDTHDSTSDNVVVVQDVIHAEVDESEGVTIISDDVNETIVDSQEVSETAGYRKKSLGTAKKHIEMLEEHILTLEEDISNKDKEIENLTQKLKSSQLLVDLNNNSTISIDKFNEFKEDEKIARQNLKEEIKSLNYQLNQSTQEMKEAMDKEKNNLNNKSCEDEKINEELKCQIEKLREEHASETVILMEEKKNERNSFEEQIRILEDTIDDQNEKMKDIELERCVAEEQLINDQEDLNIKDEMNSQLEEQLEELTEELEDTKTQLFENEQTYREYVERYRTTLLSLFTGKMEPQMNDILSRIVKLRGL